MDRTALNEPLAASQHGTRVPGLDVLRLVAVLGVVLFHYGFRGPTEFGVTHVALPWLSPFARYGFLGVPVFFIISGFVIAYSAEGRSATGFAIARFARIYPTFILCMTLTFAVLLMGAPAFGATLTQWLANFAIAAPALHQPYMDSAYWSLVVEVTFYAWVTVLIAAGLFPRRIDAIVAIWLAISMLNELTIDAVWVEKIFLADYSGFFATGLLIYELYRGRRDTMLQSLLVLSSATAVFQSVHNLAWLRNQTGNIFDDWIVAGICLVSILVIIQATRVRNLLLPGRAIVAIGGVTYPLYLLHQQLGYVVFARLAPSFNPLALVIGIVIFVTLLSWAIWRFAEKPVQRWTKSVLTDLAGRLQQARRPLPSEQRGAISAE